MSNLSHPTETWNLQIKPDFQIAAVGYALEFDITWGGMDDDRGRDIAVDGEGNIYITGFTGETLLEDAFLAKYNSTGDKQWDLTWGGEERELAKAIVLDNGGSIYVLGMNQIGEYLAAFIQKYNSTGNLQSSTSWNNDEYVFAEGIALDDEGNIYITGATGYDYFDVFLAKYNSTGDQQWNTTWGGSDDDGAYDIAVDGEGNSYLVGLTKSFSVSSEDVFITKYNSTGHQEWFSLWNNSIGDEGWGIALDGEGNIYITGFTGEPLLGDAFLAKYNNTGHQQWNTTWGGSDDDGAYDIAVDAETNIYITGVTGSFGGGNDDVFITKYNSTGDLQGYVTWGDSDYEQAQGIALDGDGNIYITGEIYSPGVGYDAFMAKFIPDNTSPNVNINHPTMGIFTDSHIVINVSVSDVSGTVDTVLAEIDNTLNLTLVLATNGYYYNNTYLFSEGAHTIRIYANDTAGNMNSSEIVTFTIDLSSNSISYGSYFLPLTLLSILALVLLYYKKKRD